MPQHKVIYLHGDVLAYFVGPRRVCRFDWSPNPNPHLERVDSPRATSPEWLLRRPILFSIRPCPTAEPSELENLKVPSKHTIEVTQFVQADELLPEYIEKPYFVVPEQDSVEAFTVIRKALQKTGSVAIGKVSFAGRENIIAIRAARDGESGG